jgi:hypothetical protein
MAASYVFIFFSCTFALTKPYSREIAGYCAGSLVGIPHKSSMERLVLLPWGTRHLVEILDPASLELQ